MMQFLEHNLGTIITIFAFFVSSIVTWSNLRGQVKANKETIQDIQTNGSIANRQKVQMMAQKIDQFEKDLDKFENTLKELERLASETHISVKIIESWTQKAKI